MSDTPSQSPYAKRTYGGISGEERSRQRRERLLEAGLQVFGTLGFDTATMRDLCAHARLAERYFYENFANIGEAYEAIYLQLSHELVATIGEAVARVKSQDPMDKAAAGLSAYFSFIKEDPRRAQIMLLDAPKQGHNNIRQEGASINGYAHFLIDVAKAHYPRLPKSVNLDLVATGLIGLAVQTGITWYHANFEDSVDKLVEHNLYAWQGLALWFDRIAISQDDAARA